MKTINVTPLTRVQDLTKPLEGTFKEIVNLKYGKGYIINSETSGDVKLAGTSYLNEALSQVPLGTFVRIKFLGEKDTGREKPTLIVEVEADL